MPVKKIAGLLLLLVLLLVPGERLAAAEEVIIEDETITLNFKDAELESVVNSVARITGKTFVVDPAVRGKVTIVSSQPLQADEVYAVFLSILQVHDFAAVEAGKVIKIIPLAKAGQDLVITEENRIDTPPEDRIITRVHKLQNLQADRLVPILRPLLNARSGQMSALAVKEGNSLIITERAGNVERLLQIVRRLDQDSAGGTEVVRLDHAMAHEVVSVVSGLELGTGRLSSDQLRMAADSRTNSVLLQGDEHHMLRAKAMILHLDTPLAREGDTKVIFLRYASAQDLAPILREMDLPQDQQAREINIQADEGTNALIMTGSPPALQALQSVISQLDIRRVQLMIEAVIAEVSTTATGQLGIQWLGAGEIDSAGVVGGTNFPSPGNLGIGSLVKADEQALAALAGQSGFNLGIFGGTTSLFGTEIVNLGALIRALATDSDTNILSTPSLVTLDNHEAEIVVGQNVPFVTGSYTDAGTDRSPFQTIERRDVGIKLRVKPQINEGDIIRLNIEQEVSSVVPASLDRAAGLTTNTRNINTNVLVADGKILVLGGLMDDDVKEAVSKVPILGDIPLFGALFRHTSTERTQRNLMVFLRPVILRDQDMSSRVSMDKYDLIRGYQLGREREGVRLMPDASQPVLPDFHTFEEQHHFNEE